MLLVVLVGASVQASDDGRSDKGPEILRGKGDQCVADTEYMRRNHMDLMVHQRDDTVLKGIRGAEFSLAGCVNCHAQIDTDGHAVRVDAPGQFCQSCHSYAAVKIDCFSCHAAVPDSTQTTADLRLKPVPLTDLTLSLIDQINGHLQADAPTKQ